MRRPSRTTLALGWLTFVVVGAIYARIDEWISDPQVAEASKGLPLLQDVYYQGSLWGTAERLEGPSFRHWLGTDVLGRDVFARLVAGGWSAVWVVLVATLVAMAIGLTLGAAAGLVHDWFTGVFHNVFRGFLRGFFNVVVDTVESIPPLFLVALVGSARFAHNSITSLAILYGIAIMPSFLRAIRRHFIDGLDAHELLRILGGLAVANGALVLTVDLLINFVGLGLQLPRPTWGAALNEARFELARTSLPFWAPTIWAVVTIAALSHLSWLFERPKPNVAAEEPPALVEYAWLRAAAAVFALFAGLFLVQRIILLVL